MSGKNLVVQSEARGDRTWVYTLSGDLYSNNQGYEFQEEVRGKISGGARGIVIDLAGVKGNANFDGVVNCLDAKGLYTADTMEIPYGGDMDSIIYAQSLGVTAKLEGNNAMAYLAASTGGRFFQNSNDLDEGFRTLAALPEYTYLLGFPPDTDPDDLADG